jgi:hypothetical protein
MKPTKRVSGEPEMDSPPFLYWLIPFVFFSLPRVETQVPYCTEFLRNDFFAEFNLLLLFED